MLDEAFREHAAGWSLALLTAPAAMAADIDRDAKIVVGWGELLDTLNPVTTGNRDVGPLLVNIFDTLIWLTPDFKVTPIWRRSWSISPDGKTYTFQSAAGCDVP